MPGFWGNVSYEQRAEGFRVGFQINRFFREGPLRLKKFVTKVPRGLHPRKVTVSFRINGEEPVSREMTTNPLTRTVEIEVPFPLSEVGDCVECRLSFNSSSGENPDRSA